MNSSADDRKDQLITKKRKHTPEGSRSSRRRCNGGNRHEKEKQKGVSTALKLYDDPWKIKKTLTDSDLRIPSRLLLSAHLVKKQILSILSPDEAAAAKTDEGTPVRVCDIDTKSMHQLVLKRWSSSKRYVVLGKWNQDFVRRRDLQKGDEIGFQWDPYNCLFNLSVLKRAMAN